MSPTTVQSATVADLVDENLAFIKLDKQHPSISAPFQMNYISTVTIKDTIWAYYIRWPQGWGMSSPAIQHAIGRLVADGGWSVQRSDAPNHIMPTGPDVPMPVGDNIATWKLMIENTTADTEKVVRLEVADRPAGVVLWRCRCPGERGWH